MQHRWLKFKQYAMLKQRRFRLHACVVAFLKLTSQINTGIFYEWNSLVTLRANYSASSNFFNFINAHVRNWIYFYVQCRPTSFGQLRHGRVLAPFGRRQSESNLYVFTDNYVLQNATSRLWLLPSLTFGLRVSRILSMWNDCTVVLHCYRDKSRLFVCHLQAVWS